MITLDLLESVLKYARCLGVAEADIIASESKNRTVSVRNQAVESFQPEQSTMLSLRLFGGKRVAAGTSSDVSLDALKLLVEMTYASLRYHDEDDANCLPDSREYPSRVCQLKLFDRVIESIPPEDQVKVACRMEQAAHDVDSRIKTVDSCESAVSRERIFFASSSGFSSTVRKSFCSLVVAPLAEDASGKQRDYWFSSARHLALLEDPETIGTIAAERALRRLGARKVKTQEVPVVFDPMAAADFLGTFANAVGGRNVWGEKSFLCKRLGETIASPLVTIRDNALMPKLLGSRPFDSEGVAGRNTLIVCEGRLESYLLDSFTARKLRLRTTGNFSGVSNFFLEAGMHSPEEIIRSVKKGFYVIELQGFGINLLTGDYSKGACGFWIENGELAYPVEEVTIAGNLNEMLLGIEMIGNDLVFRDRVSTPTIKISRMMVAGL